VKRYFCFLRAINVGGHTVTMVRLKNLFESVGFQDVETFIASGNVTFNSSQRGRPSIERAIFKRLNEALGYDVHAFVRTADELAAIGAFRPFTKEKIESAVAHHIGFAAALPEGAAQARVANLSTDTDDLRTEGSEIYWLCRTRFSDSKITGGAIEKAIGSRVTFRNINTVRRFLDKYPQALSPKGRSRS